VAHFEGCAGYFAVARAGVGGPTTRPLAPVESGLRLTHQLRPSASPRSEPDESTLTSGRNGRARRAGPAGAPGLAWLGNPAALVFLTMTTEPTFRAEFKPGEGGNNWGGAGYMARPPASPRRVCGPPRHGESAVRLATARLRHGGSATGSTHVGRTGRGRRSRWRRWRRRTRAWSR